MTPKRFFLAVALFVLITCTPLYQFIFRPATVTIHGTIPPGMHIRALSSYETRSRLCRDYILGLGEFSPTGTYRSRVEATSDVAGQFTLTVPISRSSLWCD